MCLGPLMAGYLYASIGFFWLCAILSSLFLCFLPLAYIFIGDGRKLIDRDIVPDALKAKDEEKSDALNKSTVDTIVAAETETIIITVPNPTTMEPEAK
jgi:hypothetical protein